MAATIRGVVREGRVVPDFPLPEGAHVEIRLAGPAPAVPAELAAEIEAWGRASDRALELVEGPASEGGGHEAG